MSTDPMSTDPMSTGAASTGATHSRVFDLVTRAEWAMDRRTLARLVGIVHRWEAGQSLTPEQVRAAIGRGEDGGAAHGPSANLLDAFKAPPEETGFTNVGGVAVIHVRGVIAKYAGQVNGVSQPQGVSTQTLRRRVEAAAASSDVHSLLLVLESPGGMVSGVAEFAEFVREVDAQRKPVQAYIEDLGASAAYWIAAATRRIDASMTAAVGSIGVYTVVWDDSEYFTRRGEVAHLISSGGVKGMGSMGVAIEREYLDAVREEMGAIRNVFTAAVARGRRMSEAAAAKLATGEVWIGRAAVDVGLADGVRSRGEVIAEMQRAFGRGGSVSRAAGGRPGGGAEAAAERGVSAGESRMEAGMAYGHDGRRLTPDGGGGGGTGTANDGGGSAQGGAGSPSGPAAHGGGTASGQANGQAGGQPGAGDVDAAAQRAVAAERTRVAGIRAAAAAFGHVDRVKALADTACANGTSVDAFKHELLATLEKGVTPAGVGASVALGESGRATMLQDVVLALVDRGTGGSLAQRLEAAANRDQIASRVAGAGAKATDVLARIERVRAEGLYAVRLSRLGEMCLAASTGERVLNPDSEQAFKRMIHRRGAAMALHGSSDFPGLLSDAANKAMAFQYAEAPVTWNRWCKRDTVPDFKEKKWYGLSEAPNLKLISEAMPTPKVTFNEKAATIAVETYGQGFSLTFKMYKNDDLSAFLRVPMLFGTAARRLPDALVYALLESNPVMPDGIDLFHADHKNLFGAAALAGTALSEMRTGMRRQKGFGTDTAPIDATMRYLLVPPELEDAANRIIRSSADPGQQNPAVVNPNRDRFEVIASSRLANATAYYGVADPASADAFVVAFLDGQDAPVISERETGTVLELGWEVHVMGVGVEAVDHVGISKNPGQ